MPSVRGTQDVFFRKTCCEISVFWRMLHDFTRPLEEHIPMLRRNPAYLHGRVCWNSMQVCWIASVIFRVVVFCVRSSAESFLQQQLESWCVWWSWEGVVKYDLIIMMKFQFEHFGGTFLPWSNLTNWFVWLYLHHHKWDCLSLVGSTCHSRFAFILSTCTFLWFCMVPLLFQTSWVRHGNPYICWYLNSWQRWYRKQPKWKTNWSFVNQHQADIHSGASQRESARVFIQVFTFSEIMGNLATGFKNLVDEFAAHSKFQMANAFYDQGKWQPAKEIHREVLEVMSRVLGEEHPNTLTSKNNLANALEQQGKYQEAEEIYREVLNVRSRVLGEKHPNTLRSKSDLASTFQNQRKWQPAEEIHREVLEVRSRVLGEEHPDTLSTMECLATTVAERGKDDWQFRFSLDEASHFDRLRDSINKLRTSIAALTLRVDDEHPDMLRRRVDLAALLIQMNETCGLKEAEDLLRQSVSALRERYGSMNSLTLRATRDLVFLLGKPRQRCWVVAAASSSHRGKRTWQSCRRTLKNAETRKLQRCCKIFLRNHVCRLRRWILPRPPANGSKWSQMPEVMIAPHGLSWKLLFSRRFHERSKRVEGESWRWHICGPMSSKSRKPEFRTWWPTIRCACFEPEGVFSYALGMAKPSQPSPWGSDFPNWESIRSGPLRMWTGRSIQQRAGRSVQRSLATHPGKLTWNLKMEVWKMIFPFQLGNFRFEGRFQGPVYSIQVCLSTKKHQTNFPSTSTLVRAVASFCSFNLVVLKRDRNVWFASAKRPKLEASPNSAGGGGRKGGFGVLWGKTC